MSNEVANRLLGLIEGYSGGPIALCACATVLRLDDSLAEAVVSRVIAAGTPPRELVRKVKQLSCVWTDWDGSWYIMEGVRPILAERLYEQVSAEEVERLRLFIATSQETRAASYSPDGQITAYRRRQALFEEAYQRILTPSATVAGAQQLATLWEEAPPSAATALAQAVDRLSPEFDRYLAQSPPEILFLRGMAARERGDRAAQIRMFGAVWRRQQPSHIAAIAAHLYGLLIPELETAEDALRDSLDWGETAEDRGIVLHSLGNRLSDVQSRWEEAEELYHESFRLRSNPQGRAQVLHSLGDLLSKQRTRRDEAEKAFRDSLNLRTDPEDRAQVLNSWAQMLARSKNVQDLERAEQMLFDVLKLTPTHLKNNGIVYRTLADIYEKRRDYANAIKQIELLAENNEKMGIIKFRDVLRRRLDRLRSRLDEK